MMFDLAIKSNAVLTPGGTREAVVLVKDGLIIDLAENLDGIEARQYVDVGNQVLMPGVIDPHVHINEPGRTEWEGFDTATKAAIAGGITTLVDMPLNSSPVTTTKEALQLKIDAAKDQVHCHCGFWGGIVPGNHGEIKGLADGGVPGFKAFLTHSGIDDFPNVTEAHLRLALPVIAELGLPLLVHCELPDDLPLSGNPQTANGILQTTNSKKDPRSYAQYLAFRPARWEDNAIALMIRLCREFNCPVHIVHLSSAGSIQQIKEAKEDGLKLTVETAQHYLHFKAEDIRDGQTQLKCAPPIRPGSNTELLWDALKTGIIDFVATDHSPAPPALKMLETGNFTKAWGGIASLQFALPVLWTAAKQRNADIANLTTWLCENPATLAGLAGTKGKIAKGYDADLLAFDPENKFTVTADMILHKHKLTPYLGETLWGTVEQTWLAGIRVFENNGFIRPHEGKLILHR